MVAFWLAVLMSIAGPVRAFGETAIRAHVEKSLERDRVPGAAVVIVSANEVLFLQGFGTDGRGGAVDGRTGFVLGSMSKAFTALAALRLVEAGVITLDTPSAPLVPELADVAWDGVTLDHLLTHTSGLPTRTPVLDAGAPLSAYVAALAGVARGGAEHVYSSANYLVAARMLEVAAGQDFAEILKAQVFDPLGIAPPDDPRRSMAEGHQYRLIWPMRAAYPVEPGRLATASVVANAEEMGRFLRFQLGDGRWEDEKLLSAKGLATMHRGRAEADGFSYAFGWREAPLHGARSVQHGGVLPNFRGKMVLLPDLDFGVAVLTNVSSNLPLPARPTSHRLADEIARHLAGGPHGLPNLGFRPWLVAFWAALGLIALHQAWTLIRVLAGRDTARRPGRAALVDLGWVAVLVAGLPWVLGLPWRVVFAQTPDLAWWMVAMGAMALTAAAVRLNRSR